MKGRFDGQMRTCIVFRVLFAFSLLCGSTVKPEPAFGQSSASGNPKEDEVTEHFRAGQEALRTGQSERAIQEFKQAVRRMPNLAEVRTNLGLAYYLAGQYQQAVIELEKAVSTHYYGDLHYLLATAYRQLG